MFKQVEIKNFQSHKHTILNFSNGLNIIKGSTHEGKSGIIRALRWVLQNKPRGIGFKSWFADDKEPVSVSITFSNGDLVTRERGKENIYRVKVNNQDEEVYKAVRSDVPEEVKEVIQMSELNVQSQADGYFMLSDSPGERAKKINEIVGLGVIDEVTKKINGKINITTTKLTGLKEDIDETKIKLEKFDDIEKLDSLIVEIDGISEKIVGAVSDTIKLKGLVEEIEKKEKENIELSDWLEIEHQANSIYTVLHMLFELNERKELLLLYIDNIEKYRENIKRATILIKMDIRVKQLEKTQNELETSKDKTTNLLRLHKHISGKESTVKRAGMAIRIAQNKLNEIDVCPTCEQTVENWV